MVNRRCVQSSDIVVDIVLALILKIDRIFLVPHIEQVSLLKGKPHGDTNRERE